MLIVELHERKLINKRNTKWRLSVCVCVYKGWPLVLLQSKGGPGNSDLAVCCWREEGRRIGDDDVDDSNKRWKTKEEKEGEEKGKKTEGEAVQRTAVFFSQRPGRECPFLLLCSPFYKVAQAQ